MYRIDSNTGAILNQTILPNSGATQEIVGTPCVYNGVVYVATRSGMLFALNAANLDVLPWSYTCLENETIRGSPIAYNNVVYFGTSAPQGGSRGIDPYTGGGRLHAISIATQKDLTGTNPGMVAATKYYVMYASPSVDVDTNRAYIGDSSCYVTAIDRSTGAWKYEWFPNESEVFNASIPVLDGYLFQGSNGSFVWRIKDSGSSLSSDADGEIFFPTTGSVNSTPAAYNHRLYICDSGGMVYCALANGDTFKGDPDIKIWETALPSSIVSSPALSIPTGMLFVATSDAKIYALDITTGTIKWQYDIRALDSRPNATIKSSPAISRGGLYIVVDDSSKRYLYCFKDQEAHSPIPNPTPIKKIKVPKEPLPKRKY